MELTESLKIFFVTTTAALKGASRRVFMARTVQEMTRRADQREHFSHADTLVLNLDSGPDCHSR
jgi:hypothetical protein